MKQENSQIDRIWKIQIFESASTLTIYFEIFENI